MAPRACRGPVVVVVGRADGHPAVRWLEGQLRAQPVRGVLVAVEPMEPGRPCVYRLEAMTAGCAAWLAAVLLRAASGADGG